MKNLAKIFISTRIFPITLMVLALGTFIFLNQETASSLWVNFGKPLVTFLTIYIFTGVMLGALYWWSFDEDPSDFCARTLIPVVLGMGVFLPTVAGAAANAERFGYSPYFGILIGLLPVILGILLTLKFFQVRRSKA